MLRGGLSAAHPLRTAPQSFYCRYDAIGWFGNNPAPAIGCVNLTGAGLL